MNKNKKISLYDVNPRFFKDNSGNGTGDLVGLASKFDYFDYLGVNAVVLQDILAAQSNNTIKDFTSVDAEVGNINDLIVILSKAKKLGIKIFIEMRIGSISKGHNWFNTAVMNMGDKDNLIEFASTKDAIGENAKYNQEAKGYYKVDEKTQEIPLNWESEKVLDKFVEVIKFWENLGVDGFVFKDFEFIGDNAKNTMMNEKTLRDLRKFYNAIKEVNDRITVIGKSNEIALENASLYTSGSTKVFDYFHSTKISMLGADGKFGTDKIIKFKQSKLVKDLKKYATESTNILSFSSKHIGRLISRWGDDGQYSKESAKSLALLQFLTPASVSIYYADEIGARNIGLTHLDDFQDKDLEIRKSDAQLMKLSEKDFMDAQVKQGKINARSLMMWNANKNGGFSVSEKTITPVSVGYKENNVEAQFADSTSTLNFYKQLLELNKKSTFGNIIKDGSWKIINRALLGNGIVKLISVHNNKEVITLINLSDGVRKVNTKAEESKVILSSYGNKEYDGIPESLEPFESIIISKFTDEHIKHTQIIKMNRQKEREQAKLEAQKAKEAEARAAAEAEAQANAELEAKKAEKLRLKQEAETQKEIEAANKEARLRAEAEEKERQALREAKEKERVEREAQKAKEREEALKAKEKEKAEREAEKTRQFNLKQEAREARLEEKLKAKEEKLARKEATSEDDAIAKAKQQQSIMNDEVTKADHTRLTEDDIAPTTQVDLDDIDDIEEFLSGGQK